MEFSQSQPAVAIPAQFLQARTAIPILWSDGVHNDTPALEAFIDGLPFQTADGFGGIVTEGEINGGKFLLVGMPDFKRIKRGLVIRNTAWIHAANPGAEIFTDGWIVNTEEQS